MADQTNPSSVGGSTSAAAMLNQPIVIDCGSSSMKAGFAGGTKPKVSDEPTLISLANIIVTSFLSNKYLYIIVSIFIIYILGNNRDKSRPSKTSASNARWSTRR